MRTDPRIQAGMFGELILTFVTHLRVRNKDDSINMGKSKGKRRDQITQKAAVCQLHVVIKTRIHAGARVRREIVAVLMKRKTPKGVAKLHRGHSTVTRGLERPEHKLSQGSAYLSLS